MSHIEINKAIYKSLVNDLFIQEYNIGVYNKIPSDTKFPYIYIGNSSLSNISTKTENLYKIILRIDIFTKNIGDNSALFILNKIDPVITNAKLKNDNLISINLVGYDVTAKNEASITQASLRYKIITQGTL